MFSVLPCQSCLACRGLSLLTINGMSLTTKEVIPYKDTYDSIYERASIRQLLPFRLKKQCYKKSNKTWPRWILLQLYYEIKQWAGWPTLFMSQRHSYYIDYIM